MKNHVPFLLAAAVLMALFVGLEPLLTFPIWGSDTGEYYYLTQSLVSTGHLLLNGYQGWGFGYPDFPGIFILGGAVSSAAGISPLLSLEYVVPTVGALATLPLFLLFRRLYARDSVALLGAAFAAVAFPRVFILSHPVPDTLGDFFAIGALWLFVEQRRDTRWLVPLALVAAALVVSHHLSSYFFLVAATGLVVGLELVAPRHWSVKFPLREFVILGLFAVGLFSYWTFYATSFEPVLIGGIPGVHITNLTLLASVFALATLGVLVGLALLVRLRRGLLAGRRNLVHPRWPTRRKLIRDATILGVLVFGGASLIVLFPIPGTGQSVPAVDLLWFAPLLLLVPLSAGGVPTSAMARLGPAPYALLVAVVLSGTFAGITGSQALPVERHAEWAVIAFSLVTAIALGGVAARIGDASGRKAIMVGALVLLVGVNAALAYPPPQLTDGFQEGFTAQDIGVASWMSTLLPQGSVLASDHRLSDLYFGLSGNPATWYTTCHLFLGTAAECTPYPGNATQATLSELNASKAPFKPERVDAIAVDSVMVTDGVALDPSKPALPMNSTQLTFLEGPLFVLLYENGLQEVWWVAAPLPTSS